MHRVLTRYGLARLAHPDRATGRPINRYERDRPGEHLAAAGIDSVTVVLGDGELRVPEHGPYDRIAVTAGANDLPPAWAEQLAPGGCLVVRCGSTG